MEIGIDFGTTYSTLCFSPGRGVDGCVVESDTIYIPTVVGFREDGSYAIGSGALLEKNLIVYRDIKRYFGLNKHNKDRYLSRLKSKIEVEVLDWGCKIGPADGSRGKTRSVIALASLFVSGLVKIAARMTGQQVSVSVCSVPAEYNSYMRGFIFESCRLSSINVQAVVNEPTAAGLSAFITTQRSSIKYLLVYDFGGGTFDCSLLVVGSSYVCVVDSLGDNYLGGRDVDNALRTLVASKLTIREDELDSFSMEALKIDCVEHPSKLERKILTRVGEIKTFPLSQSEFTKLCEPFVLRAKEIVLRILRGKNLSSCAAVLIGGSSVLPGVVSSLANIKEINRVLFDRNTYRAAVALGAALYAQTFSGSSRYRLIDAISGSLSDEFKNLKAVCIFPKGHPIPATVESTFTMPNGDTGVVLMQGESSMANMNEMTFSATVRRSEYPSGSLVRQTSKIMEDGRVEVYLNQRLLSNTVKPKVPNASEVDYRFESSDDRRIGPEVLEIKSFYSRLLSEQGLNTLPKQSRRELYLKNGIESD